jgi:hypothetical protein
MRNHEAFDQSSVLASDTDSVTLSCEIETSNERIPSQKGSHAHALLLPPPEARGITAGGR